MSSTRTTRPRGRVETLAPQAARSAEPPLVSVLLPCYNHARFVQETLAVYAEAAR